MTSAAHLRTQIENSLASRVMGALSPRPRTARPRSSVGIPEIDDLLDGGFPVGAITELVGASCSGRTSLALAFAAEITRAGQTSAWVDIADALDPESAAAAGVDLSRQLWVRCGAAAALPGEASSAQQRSAPGLLCGDAQRSSPSGGGGSPHPRHEVNGMPAAIEAFLQNRQGDSWTTDPGSPETHYPAPPTRMGENPGEARRLRKKIGTPGMPNRPVQEPNPVPVVNRPIRNREEQPPTDRLPPRRGQHFHQEPRHPSTTMARCAETPTTRLEARQATLRPVPELNQAALFGFSRGSKGGRPKPAGSQTWQALDQALRSVDLLLNAGGFGVIVLDLGSTPAEFAWRIPLATWFRFRAAAERSRTSMLLLTQHPCARSSAELVLRLAQAGAVTEGNLLTGMTHEITVSRQRFEAAEASGEPSPVLRMRKPPQSERSLLWSRPAAWSPFAGSLALGTKDVPVARSASWTVLTNKRAELRETAEDFVSAKLRSA